MAKAYRQLLVRKTKKIKNYQKFQEKNRKDCDTNMSTKLKTYKRITLLLLCFSIAFGSFNSIHAEAAIRRKEVTKSFFFSTPRGQTAGVNVQAIITETYKKNGKRNTFTKRDCFLAYSREYTASAPKVTRTNGVHRDRKTEDVVKTFKSWTRGTYLWDIAVRPYGSGSYNTTNVTYKNSINRKSGFSYSVYCSGSIIPTQTGSVYVSLKTK